VTRATPRLRFAVIALAVGLALVLGGTASAKPLIGKDGKIHACYRVKGKPRSMIRVIPLGLALVVPDLPGALPDYACP